MSGADEVRAQAAVVDRVADVVSRVAVDTVRCGNVDVRSRAADLLRRRLDDLVGELVAGRRACDDAATALHEHAAALRAVAEVVRCPATE